MEYRASSTIYKKRSFNDKSAYDGIFAAPLKHGAPAFSARLEDYSEIFGGSRGSSIPILDVPSLNGRKHSVDVQSSKLEYSKVFGGFEELDFAVPFEELLVEPKKKNSLTEESGVPAGRGSPPAGDDPLKYPEEIDVVSHEELYKSFDSIKKFNTSYQKTNQGSYNGANGISQIAKLHAVPAYTYLIDERQLQMGEAEKTASGVVNVACLNNNRSEVTMEGVRSTEAMAVRHTAGASRQTSRATKLKKKTDCCRSASIDMSFDACEINWGSHPEVPPNSSVPLKFENNIDYSERSMDSKPGSCGASDKAGGVCSPPYFEEEVDVNSIAAASLVTLRKAIEDAQVRIKHAKESMERRKAGLQHRRAKSSVDTLHVDKRTEGRSSDNAIRSKEKKGQEKCGKAEDSVKNSAERRKKNLPGECQVTHNVTLEHLNLEKEVVKAHWNESKPSQAHCQQEEAGHLEVAAQSHVLESADNEKVFDYDDHMKKILQSSNEYGWGQGKITKETFEKPEKYSEQLTTAEESTEKEIQEKLCVLEVTHDCAEYVQELKFVREVHVQVADGQNVSGSQMAEEAGKKAKIPHEKEKCEKTLGELQEPDEGEKDLAAKKLEEQTIRRRIEAHNSLEKEEVTAVCKLQESEIELKDVHKGGDTNKKLEKIDEHERIDKGGDTNNKLEKIDERERIEKLINYLHNGEETEKLEEEDVSKGNIKLEKADETRRIIEGFSQINENNEIYEPVEGRGIHSKIGRSAEDVNRMKLTREDLEYFESKLDVADDLCKHDESDNFSENNEDGNHVEDIFFVGTLELPKLENVGRKMEDDRVSFEDNENEEVSDPVKWVHEVEETGFIKATSLAGVVCEGITDTMGESDPHGIDYRKTDPEYDNQNDNYVKEPKNGCSLDNCAEALAPKLDEMTKGVEEAEVSVNQEKHQSNSNFQSYDEEEMSDKVDNVEAGQQLRTSEGKGIFTEIDKETITCQSTIIHEENHQPTLTTEERQTKCILEEVWPERNGNNISVAQQSVMFEENSTMDITWEIKTGNNVKDENHQATVTEEGMEATCSSEEEDEEKHQATLTEQCMEATCSSEEEVELQSNGKSQKLAEWPHVSTGKENVDIAQEVKTSESITENEVNHQATLTMDEKEMNDPLQKKQAPESEVNNQNAAQPHCMSEGKERIVEVTEEIKPDQSGLENEVNNPINHFPQEETMELEKENQRKIVEAKEREREKERERLAVERAIREARERAFAEARERAASERATSESRRRVMAETRERSGKTSTETDKSIAEKASMQAKLKSQRAAVERATTEARERALEKAMSETAIFQARNLADKIVMEKLSSSTQDGGLRKNASSYDSQPKGPCSSSSSRNASSSNPRDPDTSEKPDGSAGESVQRSKARLESHQRTVERVAKVLAEKNIRDILAQKEQAERNRLAEALDADVKRWSNGKESNLRALLSTLQYILGPESGWQPIPLTDLITTSSVKKAYRKSTLFVHPDKLQQRGASIQQKYVCEKVFDLLKAAWNRFNTEER